MTTYKLPFYQKSRMRLSNHILFLVSILLSTMFGVIDIAFAIPDEIIIGILLGGFLFCVSLFCLYIYIGAVFLKLFYIEITSEYLKVCLPMTKRLVRWEEISKVTWSRLKGNVNIGIILKSNNYKNSLFKVLRKSPSFNIPLVFFEDIDDEKFRSTIQQAIGEK